MDSYKKEAEAFLSVSNEFRLGSLPTETPHPKTVNLSIDSQRNIALALRTLREVDLEALYKFKSHLYKIKQLQEAIASTLKNGKRIFLCGCGATGRLSLVLETIWRHKFDEDKKLKDRVVSFMAGGDVALIRSIEKFEDYPDFGARQLVELGFSDGDLLISCTEGGETPFVIGATEKSLEISKNPPYFLYCNPDDVLSKVALRSKNVINNFGIKKINLSVGPMALTGSTRMQASTVLMAFVGYALWFYDRPFSEIEKEVIAFLEFMQGLDLDLWKGFVEKETLIYQREEYLLYETDPYLGMGILTDTTERSPTFSLYPFENEYERIKHPSLNYLFFKDAKNSESAWESLLLRKPRTFHWDEVTSLTTYERLLGFDFGSDLLNKRSKYLKAKHNFFKIYYQAKSNLISFELDGLILELSFKKLKFISVHLILKMILNAHSTVVMGRMGRFESNLMTWVRPSNNKLIDRAVRYAYVLLHRKRFNPTYEELVDICFSLKANVPGDKALVLEMVESYLKSKKIS